MAFAPEIFITLTLMAAILMTFGALIAYKYLLSPILRNLADVFNAVVIPLPFHHIHPLRFAAKALDAMDKSIPHWLGQYLLAEQRGLAIMFHAMANQVQAFGKLIGDLANSVEHVLTHVVTVQLPGVAARAERFTLAHTAALRATFTHDLGRLENKLTHDYDRLRRFTEAELAKYARGIDRLANEFTRELSKGIDYLQHEVTATRNKADELTRDAARVAGRVGVIERELQRVYGRLGALEQLLGVSSVVGLVALALERLGLSWTRCNQVGRVGKNVCGMDPTLLEELLASVAVLALTMNLEELARIIESEFNTIKGGVDYILR